MSDGAKLAVDIGGTFTDLVLEKGGRRHQAKLLTTPAAPEEAVLEGAQRILAESDTPVDDVDLVIHGTTLATNALIERKGAKTGLIATEGFRDSVEIAYEHTSSNTTSIWIVPHRWCRVTDALVFPNVWRPTAACFCRSMRKPLSPGPEHCAMKA